MSDFMNMYFGPLDKKYCLYFYIFAVGFGIALVFNIISMIIYLATHYKKLDAIICVHCFFVVINLSLGYFSSRLLHTMCVKSI